MRTHVVQQGECIASIAHRHGISDVRRVYDHPDNADLRRKRPDPHVLLPGDVVAIPDPERREFACATGATHRFEASRSVPLQIRVTHHDGAAIANAQYRLTIGDRTWEGTTDGDGLVDRRVPSSAEEGTLRDFMAPPHGVVLDFQILIGHLDPIDEITGVQARLANLGHPCDVTGEVDEPTRRAILAFQRRHGLRETGEADEATRGKLAQIHEGI